MLRQKESLLSFCSIYWISLKRYNFIFFFLHKKLSRCSFSKPPKDKKTPKILEPRSSMQALLYWMDLFVVWFINCFVVSISQRLVPTVNDLLSYVIIMTALTTVLSSLLSIILIYAFYAKYENTIEEQILRVLNSSRSVEEGGVKQTTPFEDGSFVF